MFNHLWKMVEISRIVFEKACAQNLVKKKKNKQHENKKVFRWKRKNLIILRDYTYKTVATFVVEKWKVRWKLDWWRNTVKVVWQPIVTMFVSIWIKSINQNAKKCRHYTRIQKWAKSVLHGLWLAVRRFDIRSSLYRCTNWLTDLVSQS